jgi:putative PEP-CTERM system histidine kinase
MDVVVVASYLTAAAAFFAASALLAAGWRGQRTGAMLVLASVVMVAWSVFLAWAETHQALPTPWLMLAEVLRNGAWLAFAGALFTGWPLGSALRAGAHTLWIALALYCVLSAAGLAHLLHFNVNVPLVGVLLLALAGVVFLEQVYRNADAERRWALKFLIIGLGVMFGYDIFLYSYALLYRQFDLGAWAARGFIDALAAPLLVVAAARNRKWALEVGVSRRAVFYSTSLLVVACYIIATAVGGYFVRVYGGDWGRVAEITLVCLALLGALVVVSSGQARSRLTIFLHKNFFSFRHDYREQWLRLTAALVAGSTDTELPLRALRAVAQIMDSPAGALLVRDETQAFVLQASWNMRVPANLKLQPELPSLAFMRERHWVYDLGASPPLGEESLRAPSALTGIANAWLLVPLALEDDLVGLVLLAQARAKRSLDWEDIDLLRTAGTQVAAALVQAADAQRLAEAHQFEGFNRLTAFLMHDLKNIAAQQSLLLQNAERHKHNPAFVDDVLATVANSVRRIARLLEQLRGDKAPAPLGRVALTTVVGKALAECRAQAPKPECQPGPDELWVRADADQLATVLGHLIRNAQDAAQARGHVTLELWQADGHAMIAIKDDGAGMDADFIRTRLFQPFFTTKASRGMGIGAYQAREYIRSLGGTVSVNSTPGTGTVFTLRIPLALDTTAAVNALGVAS